MSRPVSLRQLENIPKFFTFVLYIIVNGTGCHVKFYSTFHLVLSEIFVILLSEVLPILYRRVPERRTSHHPEHCFFNQNMPYPPP